MQVVEQVLVQEAQRALMWVVERVLVQEAQQALMWAVQRRTPLRRLRHRMQPVLIRRQTKPRDRAIDCLFSFFSQLEFGCSCCAPFEIEGASTQPRRILSVIIGRRRMQS
jgi:hypothetical protein